MNFFSLVYNQLKSIIALVFLTVFNQDFQKKDDDGYTR